VVVREVVVQDTTALEKALRADAVIEMVGTRTWFSGRATCLRYPA
jgi:RNA polymerase sigma-70 factor, ECF subfamily